MTSVKQNMSFSDIQDEELARKLQREEELYGSSEEEEFHPDPPEKTQEELDFELALRLSQQEQGITTTESIDCTSHEMDEDFLLALQIQTQLEIEEDQRLLALSERSRAGSKVYVDYRPVLRSHPSYLPALSPTILDPDAEPGDYEEDYENEYETNYPGLPSVSESPNKTKPRLSASERTKLQLKEIVTKHDLETCNRKNALTLESQMGIDCGNLVDDDIQLSNAVFNELNQHAVHSESYRIRRHGKEERETREHVLDTETRLLVFKLINEGTFSALEGVISSGKESNVYRAPGSDSRHYAVKIYKTTLNEFKNRDMYIRDDFRFRYRCQNQNSKKFIKVWAEKEVENLRRLKKYGVRCPEVVVQRKHILVMECIGKNVPAPPLKRVSLSTEKFTGLYVECVRTIRRMFQKAKLVHADLSEYNILYHEGELVFIDVAQTVENQHPYAMSFLQRDCASVNKFFRKKHVSVMTVREVFDFVTDSGILEDSEETCLESLMERACVRGGLSEQDMLDDDVFLKSFIPRCLAEVPDPLREIELLNEGNLTDFRQTLTCSKLKQHSTATDNQNIGDVSDDDEEEDSELTPDDHDGDVILNDSASVVVSREELRKQRKEAKKLAKLKQRETRKAKKASRV